MTTRRGVPWWAAFAPAGCARDMQVHHAQAVELATIVRDRTDDPEIRTSAYDIALTQQQQQGQLFAWLVQWDLPQARTAPAMAWTGAEPTGHDPVGTRRPATACRGWRRPPS